MERPPNLTIEFLEDAADGLRLITASNWSIECLVTPRSRFDGSLATASARLEARRFATPFL
jgi:hypothetical protein